MAGLVLALSGCGGSDSSSGDKPSTKPAGSTFTQTPADGDTVTGTGYSFTVPKGWKVERPTTATTTTIDSQAANAKDHDGFIDNINVVHQNAAQDVSAKGFEDSLLQQLKGYPQYSDVNRRSRVHIAGELALHVDATQTVKGAKFLTDQYYVSHGNAVDVITFACSLGLSQKQQDDVAGSVLATWKWAS
ncbi:MAG: hypothetical protein JWQ70_1035 [Aeromicrobium sp.]|nr:hypothetical protein [Aeromicrobium sp.]